MSNKEIELEKARLRREARLAQALRDNLRRRKAPVAPAVSHCPPARADLSPAQHINLRDISMDRIRVRGGNKLQGNIRISGAKNAALPLMIASLLSEDGLTLRNVPRLADVQLLLRILRNHGVDMTVEGKRPGQAAMEGKPEIPEANLAHECLIPGLSFAVCCLKAPNHLPHRRPGNASTLICPRP